MLNLTGNAAIDVFIGLAFFFFLLSVVCSAVNEGIATALNLRAEDLERGIRNLLDDPTAFYAHWRVQALFKPKRFLEGALANVPLLGTSLTDKRPSYIPSRVFALTVLDTVAPAPGSDQSHDLIARANAAITGLPAGKVKGLLQDALDHAGGDAERFRAGLETSFNEAMDRVSGWYRRRTQLILLCIALVAVAAINADSFAIGQRLWKNDALRTAVVAQAAKTVSEGQAACTKTSTTSTTGQPTPAQIAGKCLDQVQQLGLPLGWSSATSPSGWGIPGKIGGLLLTAFAILLGAPFWFDVLGKVARLRSAGNTPDTSPPAPAPATAPAPAPTTAPPATTPPASRPPQPPSTGTAP
jgi:hypothetical protein